VARLPSRIGVIGAAFAVVALAVVARAAQLQLGQGREWRARAAAQHTELVSLAARRGTIYDRHGVPLAVSQETYGVGVAAHQLDDVVRAVPILAVALGLPAETVARQLRARRVWMEWPGPYTWARVAQLRQLRGVTLLRRLERFYPRPDLATRLIGRLDVRGRGASGLERAFDSVLAGRRGTAVMLRDPVGRLYPSPSRPVAEPVDGADVVLTIDAELQEIADRALRAGVAEARASGGDVVILQPESGEILALASVRTSGAAYSPVGESFEPGSTAKPFAAAALLRAGRATPLDTVHAKTGGGVTSTGARFTTRTRPAW
jgi:cell division protein FtsI (penicillin-binding protein 3)